LHTITKPHLENAVLLSYVDCANFIRKLGIYGAWGVSLDTFSPLATWVVCLIIGLAWLIDVVILRLLYADF
jgi:hypothetical protein